MLHYMIKNNYIWLHFNEFKHNLIISFEIRELYE